MSRDPIEKVYCTRKQQAACGIGRSPKGQGGSMRNEGLRGVRGGGCGIRYVSGKKGGRGRGRKGSQVVRIVESGWVEAMMMMMMRRRRY